MMRRAPARRAGRRAARRTTRRVVRRQRRRFRRRVVVGGAVLLAAGAATYGAIKLSQSDVQRIEEQTGVPAEELSDEELTQAMDDLGIQSQELSEGDKAALGAQGAEAERGGEPAGEESYLDELEKLAELHEKGILTDEEFDAKKKQLLGL